MTDDRLERIAEVLRETVDAVVSARRIGKEPARRGKAAYRDEAARIAARRILEIADGGERVEGRHVIAGWVGEGDSHILATSQGYVVHFDPTNGELIPDSNGAVRAWLCDFDPRLRPRDTE